VRDQAEQFERLAAALGSRYRLVRELGRGGMATVYLAMDLKHERQVAVKVLRPELAAALGPERFLREIQIAAVLAHPHLLPLHDSGDADGFLFYVMPYVEGETLRDRLDRQRQLPIDEAVQIVKEVADGLTYAHRLGFVHRDIKPENILFMGGHAVVADFGVATAVGAASGTRLTETGLAIGTAAYMSPEQATGQDEVDGRSDTYALGCVLYEMLAGAPPFSAGSVHATLAKKLSEPVPRLSSLQGAVSPSMEEAIRKALALLPSDRFASTEQFAAAVAQGGRAAARPGPSRASFIIAGLVVLALIAAVWRLRSAGVAFDRSARNAVPVPAKPSMIAVLPFENLGPAEDDYFAAGMTEEITQRLSGVSGLGVVSSRVARRYARTNLTIREVGRDLGIEYLLVGSVRWAGPGKDSKSVRVTLELLRASDERQLWSTTYDRVIDDLFKVQSDIATQVVDKLGITLHEGERTRLSASPTENHEAYTLYLKGRYFWNKRTKGSIETALGFFQQAADLDPGYSLAWVGVADVGSSAAGTVSSPRTRRSPRPRMPRSRPSSSTARWLRRTHRWRTSFSSTTTTGKRRSGSIGARSSSSPSTPPRTTGMAAICPRWAAMTKRCSRPSWPSRSIPLTHHPDLDGACATTSGGTRSARLWSTERPCSWIPISPRRTGTWAGHSSRRAAFRRALRKPSRRWLSTKRVCSTSLHSVTRTPWQG
jgi:serine/threonine-protein kinase